MSINIFNFDLNKIKSILHDCPYNYIIDVASKKILIEYSGLIPLLNDILGDIVEMVYYIIPFQNIYTIDFKNLILNNLVLNTHTKYNANNNIIIKLKNSNYINFKGSLELIQLNNYLI